MIKTFKKAISIFVTAMIILACLPCSVMASLSYGSGWGSAMPWTGNDTPLAEAVSSAGTALSTKYSPSLAKYPIIESQQGIYGKLTDDEVYKTYDSDSRTGITAEGAGFIADAHSSITLTSKKDLVLSFSFAYDKTGGNKSYGVHADGLLVQSYVRSQAYSSASRIDIYNPIAIRKDGVRIGDSSKSDLTGLKDDYFFDYNFESGKWYTVDFVFDFENKAASTDENLQTEYKWSAYVNGAKLGESKVTTSFYQFNDGWFRWFPAMGAEMYWDNIGIYTIDDASEFKSPDTSAALASEDDKIVVSDGSIKLNKFATVGDVKAAVAASLAENEEIRVYNSDYSAELADTESAFDTKFVVIGSRILNNETSERETIYTYYDVNIDGYFFSNPSITINNTKATGSVTLYNNSGEKHEFNIYLAVYNNGELVALNASDNELVADEDDAVVEHTTPEVDLLDGNKVKLFVWNKNEITPELKAVEKSYTIAGEYNPKCADLKSITLPMAEYGNGYNGNGVLYPAFNIDVTEYDVYSYMKSYSGETITYETVNSGATVVMTTEPDTSLNSTYAVYTVTSADGTATKEYKINYHTMNKDVILSVSAIRNGLSTKTGTMDLYNWMNGKAVWDYANIAIQDGTFRNTAMKATRPIIEIDISSGPDRIEHGVLTLSAISEQSGTSIDGKLHIYKIDESIYSDGGLTSLTSTQTEDYFGDKICSVDIKRLTPGTAGDMYYINIDADYYNSLKAAEKTKMYIGLAGEATDSSKVMGTIFGSGGTKLSNSRFNYIVE